MTASRSPAFSRYPTKRLLAGSPWYLTLSDVTTSGAAFKCDSPLVRDDGTKGLRRPRPAVGRKDDPRPEPGARVRAPVRIAPASAAATAARMDASVSTIHNIRADSLDMPCYLAFFTRFASF
jgi:hypothetical protein